MSEDRWKSKLLGLTIESTKKKTKNKLFVVKQFN